MTCIYSSFTCAYAGKYGGAGCITSDLTYLPALIPLAECLRQLHVLVKLVAAGDIGATSSTIAAAHAHFLQSHACTGNSGSR